MPIARTDGRRFLASICAALSRIFPSRSSSYLGVPPSIPAFLGGPALRGSIFWRYFALFSESASFARKCAAGIAQPLHYGDLSPAAILQYFPNRRRLRVTTRRKYHCRGNLPYYGNASSTAILTYLPNLRRLRANARLEWRRGGNLPYCGDLSSVAILQHFPIARKYEAKVAPPQYGNRRRPASSCA